VNPIERRYRRLLRLLPAGYREAWEEDMVGAFLEGAGEAPADRPSFGERWSVVALAARLWLTGSHASPRGHVWYQTVRIFALLALLYQALVATTEVARVGTGLALHPGEYPQGILGHLLLWGRPAVGVVWIAAFLCLAVRRPAFARPLALLAAMLAVGLAVAITTVAPGYLDTAAVPALTHVVLWGWLAVTVLAVLATAPDWVAHGRPRRPWLTAYLAVALTLTAITVLTSLGHLPGLGGPFWMLAFVAHGVLLVAMVAQLLRSMFGRPDAAWLLALGAFGSVDVLAHLLDPFDSGLRAIVAFHPPLPVQLGTGIEALLGVVPLACAVAGLLALRRLSRAMPGPPEAAA
jgi:hypothetical protein